MVKWFIAGTQCAHQLDEFGLELMDSILSADTPIQKVAKKIITIIPVLRNSVQNLMKHL